MLNRIVDGIILKYNQSKKSHPVASWLYGVIVEDTIPLYICLYRKKETRYSIYNHAVEIWWALIDYVMSLVMISNKIKDSKLEDRSRELLLVAQEMQKSLTWSVSHSQLSSCTISPSVERALRPTIGLRSMLCYEEQDRDVCHLQKGCPDSWFSDGQEIKVEYCPTRFGIIGWRTKCVFRSMWAINITFYKKRFVGKLIIHIHPPDGTKLYATTAGRIVGNTIEIDQDIIYNFRYLYISVNEGEMEDE